MKLVILGNGFDLASNLPTSYKDFFMFRFNQEVKLFDDIENFFRGKIISNKKKTQIPPDEDAFREDKILAIKTVSILVDNLIHNKINFWDIYFWCLIKHNNQNNLNWNKVEDEIKQFVSNGSTESGISINKININNPFDFKKDITNGGYNRISYIADIFVGYTEIERTIILLNELLIKKSKSSKIVDTSKLLLEELISFELVFQDYISKIMHEVVFKKKYTVNKNVYKRNFLKLIDSENENDNEYFLLNFNYTSFHIFNYETYGSTYKLSNSNAFSSKSNKITVSEVNVHGCFIKKIIFGVDQDKVDAREPYYIFTKTYRKVSESRFLLSESLPKKNLINEVILFGHSLSDADYSYFQSIFDYYDIYESNIKLSFKFSYYSDPILHWKIKHDQINSAINLVKIYGNSLSNTKKGENLIHKLLLENRINFEDIILDQIDSDTFRVKYHIKD